MQKLKTWGNRDMKFVEINLFLRYTSYFKVQKYLFYTNNIERYVQNETKLNQNPCPRGCCCPNLDCQPNQSVHNSVSKNCHDIDSFYLVNLLTLTNFKLQETWAVALQTANIKTMNTELI